MLQPKFQPFPELKTKRLLLRRITTDDVSTIFFLRSSEIVLQFINKKKAASIKEAEDFIISINKDIDANEVIMWAITLRENPSKLIGNICFWRLQKEHDRAEIGYALLPDYWRKGIMTEAVFKAMEYGFTVLKLHSVEARLNPTNIASAAVLRSTGFQLEAYFKEDYFYEGKFSDTSVYSRLQ